MSKGKGRGYIGYIVYIDKTSRGEGERPVTASVIEL
jgi:hypothetical protein